MTVSPLKGLYFAPNATDLDIMARTLWGEARGEGIVGMQAVAWVIANRAVSSAKVPRKQFGTGSLRSVCVAPAQFSCWNASDPNRALLDALTLDASDFQKAMYAALSVILGEVSDMTSGATFYYAASIDTPAWAEGKGYVSIGRHRFLTGVA